MTGVVLSSPFLLLASVLMVWIWRRVHIRRRAFADFRDLLGLAIALGVSIWLVTLNAPIWHETLLAGGSPCGPDYSYAVSNRDTQVRTRLIGFVYGAWPAATVLMSLWLLAASLRRSMISQREGNGAPIQ